jgi:hypothetical protein
MREQFAGRAGLEPAHRYPTYTAHSVPAAGLFLRESRLPAQS